MEESSVKVQNQRVHEEYADDESFRELFATTTTTPHPTIKVGREQDLSHSVHNVTTVTIGVYLASAFKLAYEPPTCIGQVATTLNSET